MALGAGWPVSGELVRDQPLSDVFSDLLGAWAKQKMPKDPQKWLKQNPTCSDVAFFGHVQREDVGIFGRVP